MWGAGRLAHEAPRRAHDGRFERRPLAFDVSREQLVQYAVDVTAVKEAHARCCLDLLSIEHGALPGRPELRRVANVVDREVVKVKDAVSWAARRSFGGGVPFAFPTPRNACAALRGCYACISDCERCPPIVDLVVRATPVGAHAGPANRDEHQEVACV